MNSVSNNNDSGLRNFALGTAGLVAGWEGETYLRKALKYPLKPYVKKNFKEIQGGGYKTYVERALAQNNLKNDIKILDLNENTVNSVKNSLSVNLDRKQTKKDKIITHLLRGGGNAKSSFAKTLRGENAFFAPKDNAVVCNFNKFGTPVFHELQHKLNSKSSNPLIKALSKVRNPIAVFGPLVVSATALLTDKKNPEQKQSINDKIKNNCGLLSTLCMLPLTAEEFIANIKGTKIAEQAGVKGEMLKKVKKAHKLSMITYAAGAVVIGLAAWGGNKIRDIICAQKISKEPQQSAGYHPM